MRPWSEYMKTMRPESLAQLSAREGNLEGLKEAIRLRELNDLDARGHTPLVIASYNGHLEAARLLLEAGADIDQRDHAGNTALMGAAFKGDLELVRLLIEYGAEPSLANPHGITARGKTDFVLQDDGGEHPGCGCTVGPKLPANL